MYDSMIAIPVTSEMKLMIKKVSRENELSMNQFCRDAIKYWLSKSIKKESNKRKSK